MAAFCWFYSMRPVDFYALTLEEFHALGDFMHKSLKEKK